VNRGLGSSFTIRNVLEGMPFEMSFDIFQPLLLKVEVLELARRKRAKLYYLRDKPDKQSLLSQNYQPKVRQGKQSTSTAGLRVIKAD
jgi:large subunit ribosomal protein L19